MPVLIGIYLLAVAGLTYAEFRQNRRIQAWVKPFAALLFVLIAIGGGALYWTYGQWVVGALVFCAIGDVLLLSRGSDIKFKLGMAAFAIGHLLYVVAFLNWPGGTNFVLWAAIPAIAGAAFHRWLSPKLADDMKIPVTVYTLIILSMTALSLGIPVWIVPLAAITFAISDMFVARDRFVVEEPRNALAITPLYFGAQLLFALSAAI